MAKCWTQYLKNEKKKENKYSSFCSFCGCEIECGNVQFKIQHHIGVLGAYCPECWSYEFPDPNNPNKYTPLMKIIYNNKGRRIELDLSDDEFDVTKFI